MGTWVISGFGKGQEVTFKKKGKGNFMKYWHPSKVPYSLWDHSPFLKAFFKKSVKYFGSSYEGCRIL